MLDLNSLLLGAGVDPAKSIVVRHKPAEPALKLVMPWIIAERPDLFRAYQQFQWVRLEGALTKATTLVAFWGDRPKRALFAGVWDVVGAKAVTPEVYWSLPENRELQALGMHGLSADQQAPLMFDLVDSSALQEWKGKLVIEWPGLERSWWRWASRNSFPVAAITEESQFTRAMKPWNETVLSWDQLQILPRDWQAAMSQWRGVYFIYDLARERGYVGSASGAENILGRWKSYAASGHGGNVQLRASDPKNLRFSVLQLTAPNTDPAEVVRLESTWKDRLHTREHGLNEN